jgi:hypothetical protein
MTRSSTPEPTSDAKKNLVIRTATDTVAAPAESVWNVLSDDFIGVSKWAGGVKTSEANPATPTGVNGSPYGGRICDVDGIGLTDERIVAYDASERTMTYSVSAKKIPFFVDSMTSMWRVDPGDNESTSKVSLTVQATTKGLFGRIGKIPLNKMISGAAPGLLADLKTWVESAERSERTIDG